MNAEGSTWFDIEGHRLGYPTSFRDGSSMMALFLASATRTQRLVTADSPFTVAQVAPGRTVVGLNCVHYTDTDCGRYDEVALSVFVEPMDGPPGRFSRLAALQGIARAEVASYTWLLGVSTSLARDCGIRMWGFPKQLAELHFSADAGRARMAWRDEGSTVLELAVPTSGSRHSGPMAPPVYSMMDGRPQVGRLHQRYTGVGYHRREVQFVLGDHPIANQLRELKLSRRPLIAVSNAHLEFEMSAPEPLG
jgi:hypothetical protein